MQSQRQPEPVEVSVVIPCLNEQETLANCIEKARRALRECNIAGEIVVADNDSTDLSRTIGQRAGARVIMVREPGYGSALMGGIAAAGGRFIVIGDADESYDFLEIPKCPDQRRLLRSAWFYESHVRTARSALHRNGVRNGDDHQSQPARRKNR